MNQRVVTKLLEKHGCVVTVANDGLEALQILERGNFDVVLMDVQMPVLDGLEATSRQREREKSSGAHIPVLALTAYAMQGDADRCRQAGMDGYVAKPVHPAELYRTILDVLAANLPSSMGSPT